MVISFGISDRKVFIGNFWEIWNFIICQYFVEKSKEFHNKKLSEIIDEISTIPEEC